MARYVAFFFVLTGLVAGASPQGGRYKTVSLFESSKIDHPRSTLGFDGAANDQFGWAVAVDGDLAVVGAPNDEVESVSAGSAYVLSKAGGEWALVAKLAAFDGRPGFRFGAAVAVSDERILVGAPGEGDPVSPDRGAVYAFAKSSAGWEVTDKLTADYLWPPGVAQGKFGSSIAIDGDVAVIGAPFDSGYGPLEQGAAYVFKRAGNAWNPDQRLDVPLGNAADQFGSSVAVSAGSIVIGAVGADPTPGVITGAAYVFSLAGFDWTLQATITAPNGAHGDGFGGAVAIEGDTIAVGADRDDAGGNIDQGTVQVFKKQGGQWLPGPLLAADDGAAMDRFGHAVDLRADALLVGAHNHAPTVAGRMGSAYFFVDTGAGLLQQARFDDEDGQSGDTFGWSVALDGDDVLAGSPTDDLLFQINQGSMTVFTGIPAAPSKLTSGTGAAYANFAQSMATSEDTAFVAALNDLGAYQSAIYVYTKNGASWDIQQRLAIPGGSANAIFGYDIAVDGDTAAVGECGAERVHVYKRVSGTWEAGSILESDDGANGDFFGCAVALSGATVAVGAFEASANGYGNQGAVYVFVESPAGWQQQAKLIDEDLKYEFFGEDVAIDDDTIVVGALGEREPPLFEQYGAAHVFRRVGATWSKEARLLAPDQEVNKQVGASVAIQGDRILAGAPGDGWSVGAQRGAAYLYTRAGNQWQFTAKFTAPDAATGDEFGARVALTDDIAIVSAPGHDLIGKPDAGSVYLFSRAASGWADLATVVASDVIAHARFGHSLAASEGVIFVGAPKDDGTGIHGNRSQGAAYVFDFASPQDAPLLFRNGFE